MGRCRAMFEGEGVAVFEAMKKCDRGGFTDVWGKHRGIRLPDVVRYDFSGITFTITFSERTVWYHLRILGCNEIVT